MFYCTASDGTGGAWEQGYIASVPIHLLSSLMQHCTDENPPSLAVLHCKRWKAGRGLGTRLDAMWVNRIMCHFSNHAMRCL